MVVGEQFFDTTLRTADDIGLPHILLRLGRKIGDVVDHRMRVFRRWAKRVEQTIPMPLQTDENPTFASSQWPTSTSGATLAPSMHIDQHSMLGATPTAQQALAGSPSLMRQ